MPTDTRLEDLLYEAYYAWHDDIIAELLPRYHEITGKPHPVERLMEIDAADDGDITAGELYRTACASGVFSDWWRPEEEEAWAYLQSPPPSKCSLPRGR